MISTAGDEPPELVTTEAPPTARCGDGGSFVASGAEWAGTAVCVRCAAFLCFRERLCRAGAGFAGAWTRAAGGGGGGGGGGVGGGRGRGGGSGFRRGRRRAVPPGPAREGRPRREPACEQDDTAAYA